MVKMMLVVVMVVVVLVVSLELGRVVLILYEGCVMCIILVEFYYVWLVLLLLI